MPRIRRQLAHPFAQHILVDIEVAGRLHHRNARSFTSLTASSLNSRLNLVLCIQTLQFRQTPCLSVRKTGSGPERSEVDFFVDFEFRSKVLRKLIGIVFHEAMLRIVRAFERRAEQLHGARARA